MGELKLEQPHKLLLPLQYLTPLKRIMCDLLRHYSRMQRINILILRGQVHAGDACPMDVVVCELALVDGQGPPQVLVEQRYCEKVAALAALEGSTYFHHPVDHFGPIVPSDCVSVERGASSVFVFDKQVLVDG